MTLIPFNHNKEFQNHISNVQLVGIYYPRTMGTAQKWGRWIPWNVLGSEKAVVYLDLNKKMHQAEKNKRNLNGKQGQIGTGRGCSGQRGEALTHGDL